MAWPGLHFERSRWLLGGKMRWNATKVKARTPLKGPVQCQGRNGDGNRGGEKRAGL